MEYKYMVLVNTTLASFMSFLDSNIVVLALPTIVRELPGTSAFDGVWIILGYSIVAAVMLLTLGRFGDIFGRVKMYNLGFAVFTVGSALCGVSPNGATLVGFRIVQGLGSALIFANNNAILTDAFPSNERGRAIGVNQVVGIMGSVVGLTIGGVLTQTLGWRSIFWINIPVGGFSTVWAYFRLRELSVQAHIREGVDVLGNLLFAPGVGFVLYGLTFGAFSGWGVYEAVITGIGLILIVLFVYAQTRIVYPMMDLRLFKNRVFSSGIISNLFSSIARGGVTLNLSIFFQGVLLYDAYKAGILMLPYSLAFVAAGPLSGYLSDKYGPTRFVTAGLIVGSVGLALLAFFSYNPSPVYSHLVVGMILSGAGNGMFVAPNIASIMNSVQPTRRGVASGMATLIYNVGSLFSVSLIFVVLATVAPRSELQNLFAGLPVQGDLNSRVFGRGVSMVYGFMGVFNFLALAPLSLRLKR